MVARNGTAAGPNMRGNETAGGTRQSQGKNSGRGFVPFVRASAEHSESVGYDVSTVLTNGIQTLPDITVPAYGFLRSIVLVVTATGGAASTALVANQDAPFNVLQNIVLQEPNGAQICNFPSGYDLYLANKFGGYRFGTDARNSPNYVLPASATVGGTGFVLRIPVEVNNRDGLGSLPNQNSGALFRVKLNLNAAVAAATGLYVSGTLTSTTVRVRAFAEEWDQPEDSTDGVANQTVPPAVNTTQYWSRQDFPINAGQANIRLTRMGNYLRNLIFTYRPASGIRDAATDALFPDPATIYYDTRPLDNLSRAQWLERQYEKYGYVATLGSGLNSAGTIVAGAGIPANTGQSRDLCVFPYDFCHEFDGRVGGENRSLWLPTWSSTRFEIGGTWGASGTLSVLTNDVTIADNVWAPGT